MPPLKLPAALAAAILAVLVTAMLFTFWPPTLFPRAAAGRPSITAESNWQPRRWTCRETRAGYLICRPKSPAHPPAAKPYPTAQPPAPYPYPAPTFAPYPGGQP